MKTSRRRFFRSMSVLGLSSVYTLPLYAKSTKEIVKYQPMPKVIYVESPPFYS